MARVRIGDLLVRAGLIDEMQLQSGLAHQRQWGGRLGDALVELGFLDEMMLWRGLAKQLGLPLVSLPDLTIERATVAALPRELAHRHDVFAIEKEGRDLLLASADPADVAALDEVAFRTGLRLRTVIAPLREIHWAIARYYDGSVERCPEPRMRENLSQADAPLEIIHRGGGSHIVQNDLAQAATPLREVSGPTPPLPSGPAQAHQAPPGVNSVDALIHHTTTALREVVEACIARGIFTREEYLARLRAEG